MCVRESNPAWRISCLFYTDNFLCPSTLPVCVWGCAWGSGRHGEEVKGCVTLADVWFYVCVCVLRVRGAKKKKKKEGSQNRIRSTSIKSNLVTVQCSQLTVWKTLPGFVLLLAYFGARKSCPQQFSIFLPCVIKRWLKLSLNTILTRFHFLFSFQQIDYTFFKTRFPASRGGGLRGDG